MELSSLKNGITQAAVSPEGATVLNCVAGRSVIIYPQATINTVDGPRERGGAPICFPVFGAPTGRFSSEINQHGWLRNQKLKAEKKSENSLTFSGFRQKRESVYPWILQYEVEISIKPGELFTKLTVRRINDGVKGLAPVNPAFHPYFCNLGGRTAIINGERFVVRKNQTQTLPLRGKEILVDLGRKQVKMRLGGEFGKKHTSYVALWTDSELYFCVEPILAHPGSFDAEGGRSLKQGETLSLSYSLSVLP